MTTQDTNPTEDTNPQTPEDEVKALIESIGGMTIAQVVDVLGRAVSYLDEFVLDTENAAARFEAASGKDKTSA
jgi:hypothetical protein